MSEESLGDVPIRPPSRYAIAFAHDVVRPTPEEKREDARSRIAYIIIGLFVAVLAACFYLAWMQLAAHRDKATVDDVLKIVQAILSPVVAIVGAVTGFYFSSAQAAKREKPDR